MAAIATGLGALIFGKKKAFGSVPKAPDYNKIDPSQVQQSTLAGNQAVLPQATALAQAINATTATQFKAIQDQLAPGAFDQYFKNINAQQRGELGADVISANDRYSNALAMQLGVGGGSPFRLGLTGGNLLNLQLQQQQRGMQNFAQLSSMLPKQYDFTQSFFSPQQRYTMQNEQGQNAWQRDWLANQMEAQPKPFAHAMTQALIKDEDQILGLVGTAAGAAGGASGGM